MGRISRSVPLDQLRQPATDVRERRPETAVKSLAASMGDPNTGQLQDALVCPHGHEDLEAETDEELHELFQDGHDMQVIDGETRRLAAQRLGWATLDCTIVDEPPEDQIVAQLDANTERIEMSEFETVRALYEWYQETPDVRQKDVAEKTGYSPGHVSRVFSLIEGPDWVVEPWRHPDHPLETSHALAVMSFLSSETIEAYAEAGGMTEQAAHERAVEDARLMVDVQAEHSLDVGKFRKRAKRKKKETTDALRDQRSLEEKRDDGQAAAADGKAETGMPPEPDPEPCIVCGDEADTKIALDVCRQDYGMLSEMKANGGVLMADATAQPTQSTGSNEPEGGTSDAAQALAAAADVSPEEAMAVVEQVQEEAAGRPQGAQDD